MTAHVRQAPFFRRHTTRLLLRLFQAVALLIVATASEATSFDCTKAATSVEKLICSDKELSTLDDKLAVAYKLTLDVAKDKSSVRHEQTAWLKERDTCTSRACLKSFYAKRIFLLRYPGMVVVEDKSDEIRKLLKGTNLVPAPFGATDAICNGFLKDFRDQKNIEHLAPSLQLDNYDAPGLAIYKERCPNLQFNKHVTVEGPTAAATGLFIMEREGRAFDGDKAGGAVLSVEYGERNFKVWTIDSQNDPKDVADIIYYDEWKRKRGFLGGQWVGDYNVINLDDCSLLRLGAGSKESTGAIRYSGKTMIYSLWIVDQSVRSLTLFHWEKSPTGALQGKQLCVFNVSGSRN